MLQPEVFGLMSFALVWIGALAVFRDMEVGSALIYRKNHITKAANAAFFLSLLTAIALTGLAIGLASVGAVWAVHPWGPSWSFHWPVAKELLSYGSHSLASLFLLFLSANVD